MGRYLKNVNLHTAASRAIIVPASTTADGPHYPEDGMIRFNTDYSPMPQLQWFFGGSWWNVANRGLTNVVVETHTGNEFTATDGGYYVELSNQANSISDFVVFIGGVYQIPNVHYTFTATTTLKLSNEPPTVDSVGNSNYITIIFGLNSTNAVYTD